MQIRNGGRGEKPIHSPYTFNDYGTGMMGAYAVMLALLQRKHTGKGQFVHTSLAQTGSTMSSPYLIDHDGYERDEIEGLGARRLDALNGLYEAADGWLAIADADWRALVGIDAFAHLSAHAEFATLELRAANDAILTTEISIVFAEKIRSLLAGRTPRRRHPCRQKREPRRHTSRRLPPRPRPHRRRRRPTLGQSNPRRRLPPPKQNPAGARRDPSLRRRNRSRPPGTRLPSSRTRRPPRQQHHPPTPIAIDKIASMY